MNWFDSKVNQFQAFSKPVLKILSVKQSIETIKQDVVFPLLWKTLFFSKGFDLNQLWIRTKSGFTNSRYPEPTHTSNNKAINQSSWIWRHQSLSSTKMRCSWVHFRPSEKKYLSCENGVNSRVALEFTLAQERGFSLGQDPFLLKRANFRLS